MAHRTRHSISETDRVAAGWVIRSHADNGAKDAPGSHNLPDTSDTDDTERDAWLAAAQTHQAAYDLASDVWDDLAKIDTTSLGNPGSPAAANDQTQSDGAVTSGANTNTRTSTFRWLAIAAAILVLITGGWAGPDYLARNLADYQSGRGEIRDVILADGSRLTLDSATALNIHFDATTREIELISGRASFDVAPANDTTPPFVVRAAGGTIRALGTRFDVSISDEGPVTVTAIEHQIEVTPNLSVPTTRYVLSPGQQIAYGDETPAKAPVIVDLGQSTSWQRGLLVFDHRTLADVVTELNRYAHGTILVAGNDLANREVSGVFRIDRIDQVVDFMSESLNARTLNIPGIATVLIP